jgi:hypothetical protein
MGSRRSREQWAAVVDELAASGEKAESFCRRRGIRRSTLYWWKWKLASSPRRATTSHAAIRLLSVEVASRASGVSTPGGLVIEIADVRLHVEAGTDVAYVGALVDRLRPRC